MPPKRGPGWYEHSPEHALAAKGIPSAIGHFPMKAEPRETQEMHVARFKRLCVTRNMQQLKMLEEHMSRYPEDWPKEDVMIIKQRIQKLEMASRGVPEKLVSKAFVVMNGPFEPTERSIIERTTGFNDLTDEELFQMKRFLQKMPKDERTMELQHLVQAESGLRMQMKKDAIQMKKRDSFSYSQTEPPQFVSDQGVPPQNFTGSETLDDILQKKKLKKSQKKSGPKYPMSPELVEKIKQEQKASKGRPYQPA
jgi:hypothetical protein